MEEKGARKLLAKNWSALQEIQLSKCCDIQVKAKLEMEDFISSSIGFPASCESSYYVMCQLLRQKWNHLSWFEGFTDQLVQPQKPQTVVAKSLLSYLAYNKIGQKGAQFLAKTNLPLL